MVHAQQEFTAFSYHKSLKSYTVSPQYLTNWFLKCLTGKDMIDSEQYSHVITIMHSRKDINLGTNFLGNPDTVENHFSLRTYQVEY